MKRSDSLLFALATTFLILTLAAPARAVQYPVLDPNYTQQIYTGPFSGSLGAWTPAGNLLSRNGSSIQEYSLTQNTVYQGTNLHGVINTYSVSGLSASGVGMTNGLDGYIYANVGTGLQKINPSTWTASSLLAPIASGPGYGITTLSDGRIAFSDGNPTSNVYVYDPVGNTNTLIYSAPFLVDGMVSGPGGVLALAGQSNSSITVLTSSGTVLNSFATPHYPDGLAFSANASSYTLYSNNNDGTISRYTLGLNFSGTPSITDIATGSGAYGDLAAIGPDCAFYVTQFENGGYHGSTAGIGTHWDNSVTTTEASIVRIGFLGVGPDGLPLEVCEFYTPVGHDLPEPATLALLATGATALLTRRRTR